MGYAFGIAYQCLAISGADTALYIRTHRLDFQKGSCCRQESTKRTPRSTIPLREGRDGDAFAQRPPCLGTGRSRSSIIPRSSGPG